MCAERTADESRQHAIDVMGEDLGRFYQALSNELAWVYLKWGEYVALFGTKHRAPDGFAAIDGKRESKYSRFAAFNDET